MIAVQVQLERIAGWAVFHTLPVHRRPGKGKKLEILFLANSSPGERKSVAKDIRISREPVSNVRENLGVIEKFRELLFALHQLPKARERADVEHPTVNASQFG
jgi:hypothetical protein